MASRSTSSRTVIEPSHVVDVIDEYEDALRSEPVHEVFRHDSRNKAFSTTCRPVLLNDLGTLSHEILTGDRHHNDSQVQGDFIRHKAPFVQTIVRLYRTFCTRRCLVLYHPERGASRTASGERSMIPVDQNRHGLGGNCMAACLASILELPLSAVPFPDLNHLGDSLAWLTIFQGWLDWLAPMNLTLVEVDAGTLARPPRGWVIMGVESPLNDPREPQKKLLHAVVALNGQIMHDPHAERRAQHFKYAKVTDYTVIAVLDPTKPIGRPVRLGAHCPPHSESCPDNPDHVIGRALP